ncbi:hypothetical protein [Marinilabilia rubra]|uniref:Uncharacterized protein n=1 Tax=Marinilabilia rubra TaxID=2162893 RepID=A0A2U2B4J5_9BACT|nr:hypothetical protein [Marinilabilia rubra]PWD97982.1 hypothetical protein DDZ16_18090 [Marinilabilia rubra]
MAVNKFASHYMLAPDGTFVKWPVVAIDDSGEVQDVYSHMGNFREEPGVRFFSGLMVPAFIDWITGDDFFQKELSRFLNRHFTRGSLYLLSPFIPEEIKENQNRLPRVLDSGGFDEDPASFLKQTGEQGVPLFDRIIARSQSSNQVDLSQVLFKATSYSAEQAGLSKAGRLAPGFVPGLVLIQNLDLANLRLYPNSSIKWLNVPDLA